MRIIVLANKNAIIGVVVKAFQDAGITVKKNKYEYVLGNNVFALSTNADGSIVFVGGEDGLLGDEELGYDLSDLFEGITKPGKQLDKAIKKAVVILNEEIQNYE